jgi:Protein of unknown function (DUF499)
MALPWKPWHKVVLLREDLKSGDLALATFAADLYDVAMKKGQRQVYEDPKHFFALTYPTYNLRKLAKDVVMRLAGKNEKAVRQLELTYGGGKTHTLITLYHLASDPKGLPDLPAVSEFKQEIGIPLPQARIAALCFDKLDVEKGMEVRGPKDERRWLKNPWSVMAFQLAGPEGLKVLHPDDKEAERDSAPAENLLVDLLALPGKEGLSTLILIDEVLMYVREKAGRDPAWRGTLINFFQYLTQAATKVDKCAIVASLLATDPRKSDELGKELTHELYSIFRREREEGVQPVVKEDVAEILRRRFFTPESIKDRTAFGPHVVAALRGIAAIDEQTEKEAQRAEKRFADSFPFHPDLTDVFYSKWTNLEGFQRTRGILRTFALGLRDAEKWDESPLVSVNIFLDKPGNEGICEAARELTSVATSEDYEGKRQEWTGILEGELSKARRIETETTGLKFRELEQAVFATFLHSQPVGAGHKALTRELCVLVGATRPDRIELEKALRRWADVSWFLDEGVANDAEADRDGKKKLPKAWRLGSRPNLHQMHYAACETVSTDVIDAKLRDEIGRLKSLTLGASAAGAKVHNLPERPRDIEDDGEFHYVVLGPKAVSESGKPNAESTRFIDETSGPDKPRVFRNSVVAAVPSRDGLEATRASIRDYLGWEEVRSQLKRQEVDPIRLAMLEANLAASRKRVPESIEQAYCIVVTVSEKNDVQAFKVTVGGEPLFQVIKTDSRARVQESAVSAEALLPGGPYDLWREGETTRRLKDLVGAFAQFPHLPKMLNRGAILTTLLEGCRAGLFVLRSVRPDKFFKTWWREVPGDDAIKDPGLEVVLPGSSIIADLGPALLAPGNLPELWKSTELKLKDVIEYFHGGRTVKVRRDGYEDTLSIPRADRSVVEAAAKAAVKQGILWMTDGPASILGEEIPAGLLSDTSLLQAPPEPVPPSAILPKELADAWAGGTTTAIALAAALSRKAGETLPWATVRDAIDGGFRARMLERTLDSGPWPCDLAGAQAVRLQVPKGEVAPPPPPPVRPGVLVAEASLRTNQIQDLAEVAGDLASAAAGYDLKFNLRVELGGDKTPTESVIEKVNAVLKDVSAELKLR